MSQMSFGTSGGTTGSFGVTGTEDFSRLNTIAMPDVTQLTAPGLSAIGANARDAAAPSSWFSSAFTRLQQMADKVAADLPKNADGTPQIAEAAVPLIIPFANAAAAAGIAAAAGTAVGSVYSLFAKSDWAAEAAAERAETDVGADLSAPRDIMQRAGFATLDSLKAEAAALEKLPTFEAGLLELFPRSDPDTVTLRSRLEEIGPLIREASNTAVGSTPQSIAAKAVEDRASGLPKEVQSAVLRLATLEAARLAGLDSLTGTALAATSGVFASSDMIILDSNEIKNGKFAARLRRRFSDDSTAHGG
jgi:hypothetical protein